MKRFFYLSLIFFCAIIFYSCKTTEPEQQPEIVEEPDYTIQQLIRAGRNADASSRFKYQYDINAQDAEGNTALHVAAERNVPELVAQFVAVGADTKILNNNGDTPLHYAIKTGAYESAKILAFSGDNIFAQNASGVSALDYALAIDTAFYDIFINEESSKLRDADGQSIVHYFAQAENEKAIKECIDKKLPLSVHDKKNYTPLDLAFDKTNVSDKAVHIAADLIMGGADPVTSEYLYFQTAVKNRNLDYRFTDGQTPLHQATIHGHTNIARYLLQNRANTKAQDGTGSSALHEAVRYGRLEIARMLLSQGASINAEDNLGKTPVMIIIPDEQQNSMYDLLLSYHADVKHKDTYGDTVLHNASMTALPIDIVKKLVYAGAFINERNKEGITPIILAIERNLTEHITYFAENGGDIHSADKDGTTPLTIVLKKDHLLPYLVTRNNVMSRDSSGNTPLHVALINDASFSQIQYISSLMTDVNTRNSNGDSALYLAVKKNEKQVGELLLARGADIFSTNNQNFSPLRLALQPNNPAGDWLITSQTIAMTDGSGNTPLHYAAEWGMNDAAVSLMTRGAETSAINSNGQTALFNATKSNNTSLINHLIVGGCSIFARDNIGGTPLHTAVRWNSLNAADDLIRRGAEIDAQNLAGKSPLAEAVAGGNTDMAYLLLANGANVNLSDNNGRSILMDSVKSDSPETVDLLLAYGANPQIQEMNGRNAYHEAALAGNIEIISLIREAGGNPLMRDKNGNTPFILSLDKGDDVILEVLGTNKMVSDSDGNSPTHIIIGQNASTKVLELLMKNGFPIDTRNAFGSTPLSIAVAKGDKASASILLTNGANPFTSVDKAGNNAAIIALNNNDINILSDMAKYAGTKSDIQGNTLLHYAARISPPDTIMTLVSYGLDATATNISGETPYDTAIRWKRNDVATALQVASR